MIYICIPTHNEQQTVGVVLWKLRQVLTDFPRDYQLLVADDASTDKTPEVLEPYTRVLPLTVIRCDTRQGSAASLEMLLREAVRRSEYPKRDVIVTLQADFSEEPDDVVALVKRLEAGADVAVGNKVSASKETRTRRFARSLAGFFMRRQKWPEGVSTPFEGFRAYRLHAVKRAVEDRADSRVIRHDGWAGHAELLKAVLPHARRVDVVNVDERPDRLQRPRREKPFAAAMQVRSMVSGMEPPGLTGVEELDRIARTASRSRDRSAVTTQSLQAERGASGTRTNGSRTRQGTGARRDGSRPRGQSNGRTRAEGGQSPRRERAQPAEKAGSRSGTKSGESRSGRTRAGQGAGRRRKPAGEEIAAAAAVVDDVQPVDAGEGAAAAETASQPKRKRRRRKRGGQGGAANTATQQDQDATSADTSEGAPSIRQRDDTRPNGGQNAPAPSAPTAEATGDDGTDDPTDPAAGKKRRRRGGRRGGKGRRRPRTDDAAEDTAPGAGASAEGSALDGPSDGSALNRPSEGSAVKGPSEEPAGNRPSQVWTADRPVADRPVVDRPVAPVERPAAETSTRADND